MSELNKRFSIFYDELIIKNKIKNASDFAKKLGVSTSLMTEINKNRTIVGTSVIQNSVNEFGLNANWLYTGEGDMLLPTAQAIQVSHEADIRQSYPLITEIEAFGGVGNNGGYAVNLDTIEERYVIPLFDNKGVDFLMMVRGSSMYPKFSSGDIVACRLVRERLFIQWNKIYVLNTNSQGAMIKRIKKSDDPAKITCKSDNKEYDDFEIPLTEINTLALVIGTIRLE